MHAAADRPEFAPPPEPGLLRGLTLAVLAHLVLVAGLMQAVKWQRDSQEFAVEAELWSALPQEAAPREAPPPPPPPPPPPQPVVKPEPPVVKAPPPPEPPVNRDAEIALEREKLQRELEKKKLAEEREKQRKLEAQKKREEELAKKKREEELARKKQEQAKLLAEAKRKEEEKKKREQEREAREAKKLAELREQNMRRIQGMAGTGAPSSTGSAAQSTGPSRSWAGRVIGRVRPNIVFTDTVTGNPEAVIEVRLAPDGTIVSRRVKKSSGVKSWDEAVLRALDKTEVLPRDTDGSVPPNGELVFRPKG